jgi:hypothetical protein
LKRIASVPGDDKKLFGRAQRAGFSGGWRGFARVLSFRFVSFKRDRGCEVVVPG